MKDIISIGLHTLINIESYDNIFFDFKDVVYSIGMKDCFYSLLEPYLTMGKIKWAPTKDIRYICQIYSKNDKTMVIRNFLLNLNVDAFDYNFLVATCLENGLHLPLIYICTQSEYEDYMMPVTKLYKEFTDAKIVCDSINETKYGHLCLWYIRMLLRGECLGQKIKDNQRGQIILQLGIFFFTEQIMGQLLSFDCKLVLDVFKLFFLNPNIDYINQKDYKDTIGMNNSSRMNKDITINMKHHLKSIISNRSSKYNINYNDCIKIYYSFETSLLQYKYIEYERSDIIEIVDYHIDIYKSDNNQEYDSVYNDSEEPLDDSDTLPSNITLCIRYQNKILSHDDIYDIKSRLDPSMQYTIYYIIVKKR